jgi:hypothetical protein
MLVSIIHLSDLNIASARDLVLTRAEAIASTTNGGTQQTALWVLLFSGDIALSGKAEEYALARTLIAQLRNNLNALHPKSQVKTVVVPGNTMPYRAGTILQLHEAG